MRAARPLLRLLAPLPALGVVPAGVRARPGEQPPATWRSSGTVPSLPALLDALVAAVDGDPATTVPTSTQAG